MCCRLLARILSLFLGSFSCFSCSRTPLAPSLALSLAPGGVSDTLFLQLYPAGTFLCPLTSSRWGTRHSFLPIVPRSERLTLRPALCFSLRATFSTSSAHSFSLLGVFFLLFSLSYPASAFPGPLTGFRWGTRHSFPPIVPRRLLPKPSHWLPAGYQTLFSFNCTPLVPSQALSLAPGGVPDTLFLHLYPASSFPGPLTGFRRGTRHSFPSTVPRKLLPWPSHWLPVGYQTLFSFNCTPLRRWCPYR